MVAFNQFGKSGHDPGPGRGGTQISQQALRIESLSGQHRGTRLDVGFHDLDIEFRVKLHTPGLCTEVKSVILVPFTSRQNASLRWRLEHDFDMRGLKIPLRRKRPQ